MRNRYTESNQNEFEGQDPNILDLTIEDFVVEDKKGRQSVQLDKLAEYLMAKHTFKTPEDTEEVLVYDAPCGVYRANGGTVIKEAMEEVLSERSLAEHATRHNVSEVVAHIQRRTYIDRKEINAKTRLINVKNGILNLVTGQLEPHTSEFLSTIQLPVEYAPEATCPHISKFFREIVAEQDVPLLEEIVGWCLVRSSSIQRLVLLVGGGANGKSTFLNLLREFLGRENCSSISLQALSDERFANAGLYGKLANLHADLPSSAVREPGVLKLLTGGDPLKAEHKFQRPFNFVNTAKLVFSANQPPKIYDDSLAMWRRWVIVNFPNQFMEDKADKALLRKLMSPKELSGLLNVALTALKRLARQGDFSYESSWPQTRERYITLSDPVTAFIESCCDFEPESVTPKQKLFQRYEAFCKHNKMAAETKKGFGRQLKAKLKYQLRERKAGWGGIAIKE